MERNGHQSRKSIKAAVALWLTAIAGCVDSIGYLILYHLFVAHMTGNTVHLAQSMVAGHCSEAIMAAALVAAFVGGSVAGRTMVEAGARTGTKSVASSVFAVEACLIVAVILESDFYPAQPHVLVSLLLLSLAMGMQTAGLTRIGSLTVHTTFVTGMLNKLAQLLAHGVFLVYDAICGRRRPEAGRQLRRQIEFFSALWLLYLAGATLGIAMVPNWGIGSLWVPAGAILLLIPVDQISPLSLEEEHDIPNGSVGS